MNVIDVKAMPDASDPSDGAVQGEAEATQVTTAPAPTAAAGADDLEPQLKYERLGADVKSILKDASATALCLSEKVLALGTSAGNIHILDYSGNEVGPRPDVAYSSTRNRAEDYGISLSEHINPAQWLRGSQQQQQCASVCSACCIAVFRCLLQQQQSPTMSFVTLQNARVKPAHSSYLICLMCAAAAGEALHPAQPASAPHQL